MSAGLRAFFVAIVIVAVLIPVAAIVIASKPELIFDMKGDAVSSALEEELSGLVDQRIDEGGCSPRGAGPWLCGIEEDPGSGSSAAYTVHAVSDKCWHAVEGPARRNLSSVLPTGVEGCLDLFDYFSFDLI